METLTLVLFLLGFGLLLLGAEVLVRGASHLASVMRISPLVIGLTVVAYGTSAPELAVSVSSAWSGTADIALGNVIGSNICNILLILGASALVAPLVVQQRLVRVDVPLMIVLSVVVLLIGLDGTVGRIDGLILAVGAVSYTVLLVRAGRRSQSQGAKEEAPVVKPRHWSIDLLLIGAGLGMLVVGSDWLVDGAVAIARSLGVSELIIGLTIVAVGTSLPELATSVVAAVRGERDIAVGNIVGSNIFNILAVLGFSATFAPDGIAVSPVALGFDIPVMIAVAVACLPIFFTGLRIERWEGAVFVGYYVAYTAYLILAASKHAALPVFTKVMGMFVLPVTALALLLVALRQWKLSRDAARSSNPSALV
ncbi:MAG: calcium/sodium antiporter [Myxococcales bacterium]|jgi:cation:H+ antiporter